MFRVDFSSYTECIFGHQHLESWPYGPCCATAHVHQLSLICFIFGLLFMHEAKCHIDMSGDYGEQSGLDVCCASISHFYVFGHPIWNNCREQHSK